MAMVTENAPLPVPVTTFKSLREPLNGPIPWIPVLETLLDASLGTAVKL
jgi:hypothetical protein